MSDKPPSGMRPRRRSGRFLDPGAKARYEALRGLRRSKAEELGLDPEVVLSNAVLEDLFFLLPLGRFQLPDLLPELRDFVTRPCRT